MVATVIKPRAFVLAVHDLPGSTAYFLEVLGFQKDWSDPGNWEAVVRDEVRVMIGHCPDALPPGELGDHNYFAFISTNEVDSVHAEFTGKGALILAAPSDKLWGWREMPVATPEGHRMMFAQWIG